VLRNIVGKLGHTQQNARRMIKINDLKEGDIVMVDFEGQMTTGDVTEVSIGNKMAKVAHGEQEYWYEIKDLYAVPLDDSHLTELGFSRASEPDSDGKIYARGPFSLQIVKNGPDHHALLHYRDETRHIHDLQYLHQLQNHYKAMTNFVLTWP
jgi:hypothetical protein